MKWFITEAASTVVGVTVKRGRLFDSYRKTKRRSMVKLPRKAARVKLLFPKEVFSIYFPLFHKLQNKCSKTALTIKCVNPFAM